MNAYDLDVRIVYSKKFRFKYMWIIQSHVFVLIQENLRMMHSLRYRMNHFYAAPRYVLIPLAFETWLGKQVDNYFYFVRKIRKYK